MKKSIKIFILFVSFITVSFGQLFAQTVDTISIFSAKMQREIKNVVILPAGYDPSGSTHYPVLYLLHGYSGRYDSWIRRTRKELPQDANKYNLIIVCPDGQDSWYWDSPENPKSQFETYVSKELTDYIDTHYSTRASAHGRAITGLSMGGHGALWLAIGHPEVFGACGSMSGGVDIRPFPANWGMSKLLGSYKQNKEVWDNYTVINQLDKIHSGSLAIIFDCGVDDFFFQVNNNLHQAMLARKIDHDYIVRPGGHTHPYWNNALKYQLVFFANFFENNAQSK